MTTGMHLWDADVWSFVLTLSLLFAAMLLDLYLIMTP